MLIKYLFFNCTVSNCWEWIIYLCFYWYNFVKLGAFLKNWYSRGLNLTTYFLSLAMIFSLKIKCLMMKCCLFPKTYQWIERSLFQSLPTTLTFSYRIFKVKIGKESMDLVLNLQKEIEGDFTLQFLSRSLGDLVNLQLWE